MQINFKISRWLMLLGVFFAFGMPAHSVPPQWESSIGSPLAPLTGQDDETTSVSLTFPFPYAGNTYTTVFVGTNGCVQLGTLGDDLDIDYDHWEYMEEFLDDGAPTLCVANMDWDLGTQGTVNFADFGNRAVITWNGIGSNENETSVSTFQLVMFRDGKIVFNYNGLFTQAGGSIAADASEGFVVGITASNNVIPAPIDLSVGGSFTGFTGFQAWCYTAADSCKFSDRAGSVSGPVNTAFDLNNLSICFAPLAGNAGYQYGPGACVVAAPAVAIDVPAVVGLPLALLSLLIAGAGLAYRRRSR